VLFKGNALLLLPATGSDIEVVPRREDEPWRDRVVGAVVLTLKRWSWAASAAGPAEEREP
jgi:hypothetical protein